MKIRQKIQTLLLAALVSAAILAPAFADDTLLENPINVHPLQQGDVLYVTGGVSDEERDAVEETAKGYNLKITNANQKSEFVVHIKVIILDKDGQEKLNATNTGPLFYAELPPGNYVIRTSNGTKQQERKVTLVANKRTEVNLVW